MKTQSPKVIFFRVKDNQAKVQRICQLVQELVDKDKKILILAGVRSIGTKASVIALTNYGNKISDNSSTDNQLALVVQGFDMNADGKIDHVDIVS